MKKESLDLTEDECRKLARKDFYDMALLKNGEENPWFYPYYTWSKYGHGSLNDSFIKTDKQKIAYVLGVLELWGWNKGRVLSFANSWETCKRCAKYLNEIKVIGYLNVKAIAKKDVFPNTIPSINELHLSEGAISFLRSYISGVWTE